MPESMKSQVVNVLAEAEVSLEDLDSAGLYFVEVSDDRVKAHLSTLPNFDTCCQRLSNAAELGVLALEAARPLEVTTEIQERFHHLSEQFEARIKQAEETLRTTLEQQFQHELERVFKEGGTLEQRVRTLVASDGVLAQTLKEKGQELSSLFNPDNTESFVAHFKTLLSSYLSEEGSLAKLFSPDVTGSYADRLNNLLIEYFGAEAGKVKQLLDPDVAGSPFAKIKAEMNQMQNTVNVQFIKLMKETKADFTKQIEDLRSNLEVLITKVEGQVELADEKAKRLKEADKHVAELEAEKRKQSFYAGNSFEQRIVSFLEEFAKPRQDQVEYTGTTTASDGRVGDIIYRLNLDGEWKRIARIALEVKNRECTRSGQEAYFLNELDSGMANRECEFGIVVACLEKNADDGKPHFPYLQVQTGNRFVVLSDEDATVPVALEAALHLVARAANAKAEAERAEIDTNRINDAVARALNVVERFRALKQNLTTSITSLGNIRQSVDDMEKEVEAALKEAQAEVRKALQEGLEPIEQ